MAFCFLLVIIVFVAACSLFRSDYLLSFPLLFAGAAAYFFLPGLRLKELSGIVSGYELFLFSAYTSLCLTCSLIGWLYRPYDLRKHFLRPEKSDRQYLVTVVSLLFAGAFFIYKVNSLTSMYEGVTQWSGSITIYYFFSLFAWYAVPVVTLLCFKRRYTPFYVVLFFCVALVVLPKFFGGRRDEIVEVGYLVCIVSLMLRLKLIQSRATVLSVAVVVFLVFSSIGTYRNYEVKSIRDVGRAILASIDSTVAGEGDDRGVNLDHPELVNCIVGVSEIEKTFSYNYGKIFWNRFIHAYVPGQLLPSGVKAALKFDNVDFDRDYLFNRGLKSTTGSTATGIFTTFSAFGWFGCLFFYFLSKLLRSICLLVYDGVFLAQVCYPALITGAILSFTHGAFYAISTIINIIVFQQIWLRIKTD